jgi:hypothetical protein
VKRPCIAYVFGRSGTGSSECLAPRFFKRAAQTPTEAANANHCAAVVTTPTTSAASARILRRETQYGTEGARMYCLTKVPATILFYGGALSISLAGLIAAMAWRNPRLLLRRYPEDVRAVVPPLSRAERRESACWAALFMVLTIAFPCAAALATTGGHCGFLDVFGSAFGVAFLFNLVDWLILDWLLFCTITPRFIVISGTDGMAGYKDYAMHLKGFLVGSALSVALGLLIAMLLTRPPT